MREAAEFYRDSPFFQGEELVPLDRYKEAKAFGKVLMLGRNGHFHHQDYGHIEMLRAKGILTLPQLTTLVLFDRHPDFQYYPDIKGRRAHGNMHCGSWVGKGLDSGLYSNVVMVGVNQGTVSPEINLLRVGFSTPSKVMKWLPNVEIYPLGSTEVEDLFYPEFLETLENNQSVIGYKIIHEDYIEITFLPAEQASFASSRNSIVISTDLDVLNQEEIEVDYCQGGFTTPGFCEAISRVPNKVDAAIVSGYTEHKVKRTPKSLENLARILMAHSQKISQSSN